MEQPRRLRICLIGAGNVASHLAPALASVADLVQIVSRGGASARRLAEGIPGCAAAEGTEGLVPDADLYLIATADDAIGGIVSSTPDFPGVWAHTSGSVPVEVFAGHKSRYGSFYPLQTFSRDVPVDMRQVPFFIEGNTPQVTEMLAGLAGRISDSVTLADSALRHDLHVAAVFACNFVNQLWADADALLRRRGLNIGYLSPLIAATAGKLADASPADAMTGPARRGDLNVIENHLASLPPELAGTYRLLSQRILDIYHPGLKIGAKPTESQPQNNE